MKEAIKKALYYTSDIPSYLEKSIITFDYSSENINNLYSEYILSIDARTNFGDSNSVCYQILKNLPYCYSDLLLSQLDSIFIVDKYDRSIRLRNVDLEGQIQKVAIIRLDSVKGELKSSGNSWLLMTGLLGITAVGTYFGYNYINYD